MYFVPFIIYLTTIWSPSRQTLFSTHSLVHAASIYCPHITLVYERLALDVVVLKRPCIPDVIQIDKGRPGACRSTRRES